MKIEPMLIVKFFKFGCIGAVVFLIDASCFWFFLKLIKHPNPARLISIAIAITVSWWLNRTFTFASKTDEEVNHRRRWLELLKFAISQLPGAAVNSVTSLLAFAYIPIAQSNAWVSIAIGSAAGLIVNFLMAHFFVFSLKNAAP